MRAERSRSAEARTTDATESRVFFVSMCRDFYRVSLTLTAVHKRYPTQQLYTATVYPGASPLLSERRSDMFTSVELIANLRKVDSGASSRLSHSSSPNSMLPTTTVGLDEIQRNANGKRLGIDIREGGKL